MIDKDLLDLMDAFVSALSELVSREKKEHQRQREKEIRDIAKARGFRLHKSSVLGFWLIGNTPDTNHHRYWLRDIADVPGFLKGEKRGYYVIVKDDDPPDVVDTYAAWLPAKFRAPLQRGNVFDSLLTQMGNAD